MEFFFYYSTVRWLVLSFRSIFQSSFLFIHIFIHSCIRSFITPSVRLLIHSSIHLSSVHWSSHAFIRVFIHLSSPASIHSLSQSFMNLSIPLAFPFLLLFWYYFMHCLHKGRKYRLTQLSLLPCSSLSCISFIRISLLLFRLHFVSYSSLPFCLFYILFLTIYLRIYGIYSQCIKL